MVDVYFCLLKRFRLVLHLGAYMLNVMFQRYSQRILNGFDAP